MATENQQGSPARSNGGARPDPNLSEHVHEVADRLQDRARSSAHRLHEGYEMARSYMDRGYRQTQGMIVERPMTSVLVGFGVGFGLGMMLTMLLTEREEPSWYERYVPDSLRDLPGRVRDLDLPHALTRHLRRS